MCETDGDSDQRLELREHELVLVLILFALLRLGHGFLLKGLFDLKPFWIFDRCTSYFFLVKKKDLAWKAMSVRSTLGSVLSSVADYGV